MKTNRPLCFKNLAAIIVLLLSFTTGIFSQNCTLTWATQTSGSTALLYSVKAVNNLVAWSAGATAVVRRTTDGGTTWTNANPNPGVITGDIYNIEALDANTAWVTTSPGATFIYKTTNGGTNWTQVYTVAGGFINTIKMVSATNGYAFGDVLAGVWLILRTTDGGATWTALPSAPAGAGDGRNNCLQITGNDMWFGTGQNTVLHSTNLGLNWTVATVTGITGQVTGIQFNSPLVGIVGGATMSKTTDGGATWTLLAATGTGTISGIEGNGNDFWYVRGTEIYRSTNLGTTWTLSHTQTAAQNDINLVQDGTTGCMVGWSAGTTGTTSKMSGVPPTPTSCNYTWGTQTSGTTSLLQAVSAPSNNVCWIAGAAATVKLTTDGGLTWVNANPNPGIINGDVYGIWAVDGTTALLTTSPAATFIYRTTNAGANWVQVFTQAGGFIDAIVMSSPTVGYAYGDPVGARWSLWKTINGGATWDSTGMYLPQVAAEAGWNNAMCVIGNNIWFGTNNTKVYRSNNAGVTGSWTAGVTTGNVSTYGVWFTTPSNGICVGTIVQKTTDGGLTWVNGGTVAGTGNMTSVGGQGNNFWLTRGTNTYGTTDFGTTWTGAGFTGTNALWATSITNTGTCLTGWSVGATGTLLKINGVPVGINDPSNEIPSTYRLEQNYPNPFNPTTKITFALPVAGNVEIKIYDAAGREVTTLLNSFENAGTHAVSYDASSLASGVYIYKLTAGTFTDSKKMVLIK